MGADGVPKLGGDPLGIFVGRGYCLGAQSSDSVFARSLDHGPQHATWKSAMDIRAVPEILIPDSRGMLLRGAGSVKSLRSGACCWARSLRPQSSEYRSGLRDE